MTIEANIINLFVYLIFTYLSYFFINFFELGKYIHTFKIKNKILLDKENILYNWTYTKNEWSLFKEEYKTKKNSIKKISSIVLIIIAFIFSFLNQFITIFFLITIILLIIFNLKDFNNEDWEKIVNEKQATILISDLGYVVSGIYTSPFNIEKIDKRRLTKIRTNKKLHKIYFEYSISTYISDNELDFVRTEIEEFPLPKRYELEAEEIKKRIMTYSKFHSFE